MGKVFAFHGGIHPPENKHQSSQSSIIKAPLAKILRIPVQQHIGVAAKVCVSVGDKVLKGQRIADAQGKFSVPIHASSSGTVCAIDLQSVPHPSGMNALCISIETDGLDQWIEHQGLEDFRALNKSQLIDYIRDRGIAGMGGAGFPTAVKLHLSDDHIVNTLIINAAECEPYITADDLLMRERASEIISGINILQHLIEPSHVIIGIEDNKPQAIRALKEAIEHSTYNIHVVSVPTKYPSGGEKQLIKLLTNVEVPSGGIPADVGIVCQNVGTVYAINKAVRLGESLVSRIVTVTGEGVSKPQNYETLIGTPFSTLLDAAGHRENNTARMLIGGPMMGYSISDTAIPVVKTSNCIIAASAREMPEPEPSQACIRCGLCEQVCPAQLLPQQLHWFAKSQEYEKAQQHNLFDCIECGACSYVCPSNIPLVQYYRHAKSSIREEQQERRKADLARERFEAKQMREQRAIDEKAEKRKARADQAAKAQEAKKLAAQNADISPENALDKLKSALSDTQAQIVSAQQALDALSGNSDASSSDTRLADLKLQQAKTKAHKLEQSIQDFKASDNTAIIDSKKLKIAAAQANTQLLKAQQALKTAQEKSLPGIEQLTATIAILNTEATRAAKAYSAVTPDAGTGSISKTSAPASASAAKQAIDLKKLKTAAAIARTKLKKAQTQYQQLLDQDLQDTDEAVALKEQLQLLGDKADATETAFISAKPEQSQAAPAAELQQNYDKAHKLYHKAFDALQKAQQANSPAVEKMQLSIDKLKVKLDNAERALNGATQQTTTVPTITATTGNSQSNVTPPVDLDKLRLRYQKALAAVEKAQLEQNPAAEKMKVAVDKLKSKLDSAEQANLETTGNDQPSTAPSQTLSPALQTDVDKLLKRYEKALVTLDKARLDSSPAVEKMQIAVDKLKAKLDDSLQQAPTTTQAATESVEKATTPGQTDQEKLQKRYNKALLTLEKARADNSPAVEKMQIAVEKLKDKLDGAKTPPAMSPVAKSIQEPQQQPSQLQSDADKLRKRYQKALITLEKARADNSPAVEKMQIAVEKLNQKSVNAEALANSEASNVLASISTESQE